MAKNKDEIKLIDCAEPDNENTDSNGNSTLEKKFLFELGEKDSIATLRSSELYPVTGDALVEDARYTVVSCSSRKLGDVPRRFEVTAKYKWAASTFSSQPRERAPWLLGAQDFTKSDSAAQVPLGVEYWCNLQSNNTAIIPDGDVQVGIMKNSAGTLFVGTKDVYIAQYNFFFCLEDRTGNVPNAATTQPLINEKSEHIAGLDIGKYCGLLMPIGYRHHVVFKNDGKTVKWKYWRLTVNIRVSPQPWIEPFLNVGTLARFAGEDGNDQAIGPIYRYTPWTSKNPSEKLSTKPRFGSIDDVVAAKDAYEKIESGGWAKLPAVEMTEPLPLNIHDGTIDEDAIDDPEENPYHRYGRFVAEPIAWSNMDFPREVE